MHIKNLSLYNFRNYYKQEVQFEPRLNLLVGPNGQGKTNILEAIYYLSAGKSYRIRKDDDLISWNENSFYLKADFFVHDRQLKLESYYEPGKKVMKINQLSCKRLSDYVGTVNAVFFSPDDLAIVKKNPQERRRFIDYLITQIKPSYIHLLNSYLKTLHQKNILLKTEKDLTLLKNQLQIWNEQLVEKGRQIIENRWGIIAKLNSLCQPIFQDIFSLRDKMELRYLTYAKTLEDSLALFPLLLEKRMNQEISKKTVLIGPHREDLLITLNGKPARTYASQGQQRALVLCLKLAEMEIIFTEKKEYPLLLLDDVLSELDKYRRSYLLNYLKTRPEQAIITMTDPETSYLSSEETAGYEVYQGKIRRKN